MVAIERIDAPERSSSLKQFAGLPDGPAGVDANVIRSREIDAAVSVFPPRQDRFRQRQPLYSNEFSVGIRVELRRPCGGSHPQRAPVIEEQAPDGVRR